MIVQGVAYLMGLAPPPDSWTVAAWSDHIHKSPSDMTQEDMWWAQVAAERKWILRVDATLKTGVKGAKGLDPKEWLEFSNLKDEAKKTYGKP